MSEQFPPVDTKRRGWAPEFRSRVVIAALAITTSAAGISAVATNIPALFAAELGLMGILLCVAVYTDCRYLLIPNWATITVAACGIALNVLATVVASRGLSANTYGMIGWQQSLCGAGICFIVMLPLYFAAGIGAGDVKLSIVLGVLVGPWFGLSIIMWTHVLAGIVALLAIVLCRMLPGSARALGQLLATLMPAIGLTGNRQSGSIGSPPIPMAPFFAAGVVATVLVEILQ